MIFPDHRLERIPFHWTSKLEEAHRPSIEEGMKMLTGQKDEL